MQRTTGRQASSTATNAGAQIAALPPGLTLEPSLPPEGVLQLQAGADLDAGNLVGRAEHVASGIAARIASIDELVAFLSRALGRMPRAQGAGP
jgi:hypothetical protein